MVKLVTWLCAGGVVDGMGGRARYGGSTGVGAEAGSLERQCA